MNCARATALSALIRPRPSWPGKPGFSAAESSQLSSTTSRTWVLDRPGLADQTSAASPATCGEAIEVPSKNAYVSFGTDEKTLTPGAFTSTLPPKLENDAFLPNWSTAATAITCGYTPGNSGVTSVLALLLPAAKQTTTLWSTALTMALRTPAWSPLVFQLQLITYRRSGCASACAAT